MPSPHSEEYRKQVQTRIQDLVLGNRPRDPRLSSMSTRRLILEGVVEEARIYRMHKQERGRREKSRSRSRSRKRQGHGHGYEYSERNEGREGRGYRNSSGEGHVRRYRDENSRKHRDGSEGRRHHRRDGERHGNRDRNYSRRRSRYTPDPVTEGPPDPNPEAMMTGGAGPAGTLRATSEPRLSPRSGSRSRHARDGRAGVSRSPPRLCGPDGMTPFGHLPKKAAGAGFVTHAMNTYRHIKAEHDAGYRSRGALERAVDGWRGKKPGSVTTDGNGKQREPGKLQKSGQGRGDYGRRENDRGHRQRAKGNEESYSQGRPDDQQRPIVVDRRDAVPRSVDGRLDRNQLQRPQTPYPRRNLSPHQKLAGNTDLHHLPPPATLPPCSSHSDLLSHPPPPPSVHVQAATPPAHYNETPAWPPTPDSLKPGPRTPSPSTRNISAPHSRRVSPRLERSISRERFESRLASKHPVSRPHSPIPCDRGRAESHSRSPSRSPSPPYPESTSSGRSISPIQMPPPPETLGTPPPPPAILKAAPDHAALFGQIQDGVPKLRKVRESQIRDKSAAASAGHVYEETLHSRNVEERERGQGSTRAWSDVGTDSGHEDGEMESLRIRQMRQRLGSNSTGDEIG